jgi:hypothetical protein
LVAAETESPDDRVFDILRYATSGNTWTRDQAYAAAKDLLPSDAQPVGDLYTYTFSGIFLDYRQKFHSDALASVIPGSGHIYCGEGDPDIAEEPGTVWVMLNPESDHSLEINRFRVTTQGCA